MDEEIGHAAERIDCFALQGAGVLQAFDASGAGQALNGAFTYDPNGVFEYLGNGESTCEPTIDTFVCPVVMTDARNGKARSHPALLTNAANGS